MSKATLSSALSTYLTVRKLLVVMLPLVALGLASEGASAQTTWYVDDDNCPGPGVGTEVDPFCNIQDGIVAAVGGDEVLVEPGTYNELIDFLGKAITVGSSGGSDVTIIDAGPVADPGTGKPVVRCDSGEGLDTVLDGFTVTGGTGDNGFVESDPSRHWGGGMFINNSSPTVANCSIENNTGEGGGMFISNGSPNITGCIFAANNISGITSFDGSPNVTNCIFDANIGINGGGWLNVFGSPTVTNTVFVGNTAVEGGGMFIAGSDTSVTNCLFLGNSAVGSGGPTGNGGGLRNSDSNPTITNSTFSGNSARAGGGMRNDNSSIPLVNNCVFWSNVASEIGNQIHNLPGSTATATISYSDIQGSMAGGIWNSLLGTDAGGNIDADPLFVDANDDNLRLQGGSPCIDAGLNSSVTTSTDLDGNVRIVGDPATPDCQQAPGTCGTPPLVDMGAYEFASFPPNQPPNCNTSGPYLNECETISVLVQLDGTGSSDPDDDELTYSWETDCPGGSFDDPTSSTPILTVDTSGGCDNACEVTLTVDDGNGGSSECSTSVTISDTQPPVVTCSATRLNGQRMLIEYEASDDCGDVTGSAVIETACCPLPVTDGQIIAMRCKQRQECKIMLDFKRDMFRIQSDAATLVVTATDECGNEATCAVELCVPDADDVDDSDSDSDDDDDSGNDSDSDDD